ncbi:MAG: hypothetical protein V7724_02410 [Sediminicola sp.]|tara:strand:+ start:62125 stop:62637 length:513 start_codon:yes stop_codon:yes gene_type:complete
MGIKKKQSGFKTPEHYFANFNGQLMERMAHEGFELPKKHGFGVPDGYFDGVYPKISAHTTHKPGKTIRLNPHKKYYYAAVAAAVAIIFVLVLKDPRPEATTFDKLAISEMENYFDVYDYGITAYEMAEIVPIDQLEVHDMVQTPLKEENIIEYLNNNLGIFDELNLENNE